ncbi:ornithine decarboxylase-like [Brachionichthys hirsutus]|uniref:ornithine decarboxylase-like n=1 Tax=Brachionichthys hirsutus TaxID=412623 RepID=UPI003604990F
MFVEWMAEQSRVKRAGLRTQPWGDTVFKIRGEDVLSPILTTWGRLLRKSLTQEQSGGNGPKCQRDGVFRGAVPPSARNSKCPASSTAVSGMLASSHVSVKIATQLSVLFETILSHILSILLKSDLASRKRLAPNGNCKKDFSEKNSGIEILDNGRTMNDFIDDMITELGSKDSEEPFFVASLDSLYIRHLRWVTELPRVKPFYAVKCNNTPTVLKTLSALGTGFDCSSKNEIELALSLGVTSDDIIYAHTTKPLSHIKYAYSHGVNTMTFDNEDELRKISLCHSKAKLVLRISVDDSKSAVRLSSKFGAKMETVRKLLERAKELDLEVVGVSFHVGSGCTESLAFKQAIADARQAFDIANLLGFQMNLLDIGGGFSGRDDYQVTFEKFSGDINAALEEYFPPEGGVRVIAEPGRYHVDSAFTLLVNVIAKRVITDHVDEHREGEENPNKLMMYYVNDGVYGSINCLINDPTHKIELYPHREVASCEQRYKTVIWGPTCDSTDKISDRSCLPELHIGDWLRVDNMGAYSASISSDFNGFEKAHIYSVVTAETWHSLNPSG